MSPPATAPRAGRREVSPWTWQDAFGYSQAVEVAGPGRTIYCAGQGPLDEDGRPVHAGDMARQVERCLDNLEAVLGAAGAGLGDLVRLDWFTTDAGALLGAWEAVGRRLGAAGCRPAMTLVGVAALAFPEMLVEVEATAVAAPPGRDER